MCGITFIEGADLTPYWNDPRVNRVFPNGVRISTPKTDSDIQSIKELVDLAQLDKKYESEYQNNPKTWFECGYFSLESYQKRCEDHKSFIVFMATVILPGSDKETLVGTCCLQSQGTQLVDLHYKEIPKLRGVAMHPAYNRTYQVAEKIIGIAHSVARLLRPQDAPPESPISFLYCMGMNEIVKEIYCSKYGYEQFEKGVCNDSVFLDGWNYEYLLVKRVSRAVNLCNIRLQSIEKGELGRVHLLTTEGGRRTKLKRSMVALTREEIRDACSPLHRPSSHSQDDITVGVQRKLSTNFNPF